MILVAAALVGKLPMWTSENRARYNRDHLRYPSDVTDAEWAHISPLIPPARRGGRACWVCPNSLATEKYFERRRP
jgi:hypothetical protein